MIAAAQKWILLMIVAFTTEVLSAQVLPPSPHDGEDSEQNQSILVDDRGFSLVPPKGWQIFRNMNGASLYIEAPQDPEHLYQRNIRVMAFNGAEYIDEITFEEFEKTIAENSRKTSNAIQNYRMRNHQGIKLADGTPAGLFYADFMMNGVAMMQMHVLTSSENYHYIMTFTDTMEHFEMDNSPYLAEAFTSLMSMQVETPPPSRDDSIYLIGGSILFVILFYISFRIWRKARVRRLSHGLDEYSEHGADIGDDEEGTTSATAHETEDAPLISGVSQFGEIEPEEEEQAKRLIKKSKSKSKNQAKKKKKHQEHEHSIADEDESELAVSEHVEDVADEEIEDSSVWDEDTHPSVGSQHVSGDAVQIPAPPPRSMKKPPPIRPPAPPPPPPRAPSPPPAPKGFEEMEDTLISPPSDEKSRQDKVKGKQKKPEKPRIRVGSSGKSIKSDSESRKKKSQSDDIEDFSVMDDEDWNI